MAGIAVGLNRKDRLGSLHRQSHAGVLGQAAIAFLTGSVCRTFLRDPCGRHHQLHAVSRCCQLCMDAGAYGSIPAGNPCIPDAVEGGQIFRVRQEDLHLQQRFGITCTLLQAFLHLL